MRTVRLATLALLIGALAGVGALAGCGAAGSTPSAPGSSAPPTQPHLVLPSESPRLVLPSATGGDITVTGTLQEGVEGGCVLLKTPDRLYQLVGGDRSKLDTSKSSKVTVTGRVAVGMMTTCQQGTPLQVTDIRPA
jgi:hypothetical protein